MLVGVNFILIILGLTLVVKGADYLISSSISLGKKIGLSEMIIGIVIIGFGTSISELVVSVNAILNNVPELSLGNIIGSNIANILLVLGVAGLFNKLNLSKVNQFDNLYHLLTHILFFCVFFFFQLQVIFGIIFLLIFATYLYLSLTNKSDSHDEITTENNFVNRLVDKKPIIFGIPIILMSIILTLVGGELTVNSTIKISNFFGISESFIGLTIIALGTSLPEIVTGVMAAKKNKTDLIIGNVIGSNIYNLMLILGCVSIFDSFVYDSKQFFSEVLILLLATLIFLFIVTKKIVFDKKFSIFFFLVYILYITNLYVKNF